MSERRVGARAEQKRRWDREQGRGTCVDCGARTAQRRCERCSSCEVRARNEARDARRSRILALWNEGALLREIAAELDSTVNSIGVEICFMRRDGIDVPYRLTRRDERVSATAPIAPEESKP